MKRSWQLLLHEPSMRMMLAARGRERTALLKTLDHLVLNPSIRGSFTERDETGRSMEVLVAKPWVITFWLDQFVAEIRIVRIERTR